MNSAAVPSRSAKGDFNFAVVGHGHADTNVTVRIYSHALPADDQRAADVWDSIVGATIQ